MLPQNFKCNYVFIDYYHTLINKNKKIFGNDVYVCKANKLLL